jgi:D-glycero-alpha-D-manno-heptose-7-phosphate kinase
MIISRTPYRISFFGGGTDYPAWYREHGGAVLSTTINKYCYISARYLPPFFEHKYRIVWSRIENVKEISEIKHPSVRVILEIMNLRQGVEIHHDGDLPARSGLGSSSAFTVGLLYALSSLIGQHISKDKLAYQAIDIEQNIIKENVGSQDQISAAFGGFNQIEFSQNYEFKVSPLVLSHEKVKELESHLMLVFTGLQRNASEIASEQIKIIDDKVSEMKTMQGMVGEAINILKSRGNIDAFGQLLHESWKIKRTLAKGISNDDIDTLYEGLRKSGAIGGKMLGAGGGGFMLLFVPPERQQKIRELLKDFIHVPFKFESEGSKIIVNV